MAWHTVTPIDEKTYRISEPLGVVEPRFRLDVVNMYLVIGRDRAALIDSGMGIGDLSGLVSQLTPLPCLVLSTHSHWDHVGANARFEQVYIQEREEAALLLEPDMDPYRPALRRQPARDQLPPDFDADRYRIQPRPATGLLRDGQRIELGGRTLQVIETPGHSPGHVALVDEAAGLLFSGDAAYRGDMFACFADGDPAAFQQSLKRLADLVGLRQICPGHEAPIAAPGWLQKLAGCLAIALAGERPGVWGEFIGGRRYDFDEFAFWLPGQ